MHALFLRMGFRAFLGFELLTALVGCGGSSDGDRPEVDQFNQPILNGTPDTGHSAVVMLNLHLSAGGGVLCSGTVVYPLTILTAAHCLAGVDRVKVFINDDYAQGRPPSVTSTNVISDSAFNGKLPSKHDVGLVLLPQAIPNITPIPLYSGSRLPNGGVALVVGYGMTSNPPNNNYSKYYGLMPIASYAGGEYKDGPGGSTTCSGDSGGPLLSWFGVPLTVAAVVSSGGKDCNTPTLYPDILPESDWINLVSYSWALQH